LKYFTESGDELEAEDTRNRRSDNRKSKLVDDDVIRSSPSSGVVGRRLLPAPPTSDDVDTGMRSDLVARIMQRRRMEAGLKTTTSAGQSRYKYLIKEFKYRANTWNFLSV